MVVLSDRMKEVKKRIEMIEAESQQLHSEVSNIHATVSAVVSEMNTRIQENLVRHATATLRVRKDVQKHQNELNTLKQNVETNQTQLVKMNESIHSMQESLTRYAIAIDEVRLRQNVLDVKTTHGIRVWKIPDIQMLSRCNGTSYNQPLLLFILYQSTWVSYVYPYLPQWRWYW